MSETKKPPDLIVYNAHAGKHDTYWARKGAAWGNSKGGYNIKLSAIPINGEMVPLPPKDA